MASSSNNKASLGCGTLILIAIIVMIFSNAKRGDKGQLETQLAPLRSSISELRTEVRNQSDILNQIRESLAELKPRTSAPRQRVVPPPGITPPEAPLPEN